MELAPTKRLRRSRADIETLKDVIYNIVAAQKPMTVRQIFYQLSTRGLIEKTEGEYNSTVCRLLSQMRLNGEIPFTWIADNRRWMRKPRTYLNLESMIELTKATYRRATWDDQKVYVEIWLEKEALSGVLYPVTSLYDVPLMVTRGYPSLSFLFEAAATINAEDKLTFIYYFGDYDPSGLDIARNVEDRLLEFANPDISFERVAVTPDQIATWNLPSRPTKRTDSRAKSFSGDSVELDAIEPDQLRAMVEAAITDHIDPDILRKTEAAEESERELLDRWSDSLRNGGGGAA